MEDVGPSLELIPTSPRIDGVGLRWLCRGTAWLQAPAPGHPLQTWLWAPSGPQGDSSSPSMGDALRTHRQVLEPCSSCRPHSEHVTHEPEEAETEGGVQVLPERLLGISVL